MPEFASTSTPSPTRAARPRPPARHFRGDRVDVTTRGSTVTVTSQVLHRGSWLCINDEDDLLQLAEITSLNRSG
jgi:hypothetical protein